MAISGPGKIRESLHGGEAPPGQTRARNLAVYTHIYLTGRVGKPSSLDAFTRAPA